jgi:C1A family cysteine protease
VRIKRYGCMPDLRDQRDIVYKVPSPRAIAALPLSVDLRSTGFCPEVQDQGDLGSCTAHGIGFCFAYIRKREGKTDTFSPSRLFIYYNERVIEHTVNVDAGAQIRDGIKSVAKQGAPDESLYPYVITAFTITPSTRTYAAAAQHKVTKYERLNRSLSVFRQCLASGTPFVFGFSVYDSFESAAVASSGVASMPAINEDLVGGHCVACVGYDHAKQLFLCRNSWGTVWGQEGYFWMPYAYLINPSLSSDFWAITQVQ